MEADQAAQGLKAALEQLIEVRDEYRGLSSQQLLSLNYAMTILVKDVIPPVIQDLKGASGNG